tara:strand:+ start:429 stop:1382 length:954 start_codon:yes stop_codon:yes gene_type:complete
MNLLYNLLAAQGRNGDTELAHVTPEEKALLESRGGAGTINPSTGLREYHSKKVLGIETHPKHHPSWWTGDTKKAIDSVTDFAEDVYDYGTGKLEDMSNPDWWTGDTDALIGKWTDSGWWFGDNSFYKEQFVEDVDYVETDLDRYKKDVREDDSRYGSLTEYKKALEEGEFTTDDLIGMTNEERMNFFRDIYKGETDYASYSEKDFYKYMPTYDRGGEKEFRTEGYKDVRRGAEKAQTGLMGLIAKDEIATGQRGFAKTGNPMIDRQRESIFSNMYETQWEHYDDAMEDVTGYREDFHTEFEDAGLDWIYLTNNPEKG